MPPTRSCLSLPDFLPPPPPPPPPTALLQAAQTTHSQKGHSFSPSILIIALILALVSLLSASIHFILRFFNRICHPSPPASPPPLDHPLFDRHVPSEHQSLIDSLPFFSFDSVATAFHKSAPDCAVCLSRFEPHDQLRLLPACCHAFHSRCIDTWLASNLTCPLCRSTINVDESHSSAGGESFRLEIGSVSRTEPAADSGSWRSYSMGSFDYVVNDDVEAQVVVGPPGHCRGTSECAGSEKDKEETPSPPGADVAETVGGRGWLKEYMDRLASSASSSSSQRGLSFRLSGRSSGFLGSSRRSDGVAVAATGMSWDMDRAEEVGGYFFRWLMGHDL